MICEESDAQFGVGIVACVDGKAKKVASFGGQACGVWYQEREGNLIVCGGMMGNIDYIGYHFQDGRMEQTFDGYTSIPPFEDVDSAWYWDEQKVTEEEFYRRVEEALAQMTGEVLPSSYSGTEEDGVMTLDELCDVLASLDDQDVATGQ